MATFADAVALMDREDPEWFRKVNVDDLTMWSCSRCIRGQVFGDYFSQPSFGRLEAEERRLGGSTDLTDFFCFGTHANKWKDEIAARLSNDDDATTETQQDCMLTFGDGKNRTGSLDDLRVFQNLLLDAGVQSTLWRVA